MQFRGTTLLVVLKLWSLTNALPVDSGEGDCPSGKQYYVCAINSYRGCCSIDPCATSCPDTAAPSKAIASVAAPAATPSSAIDAAPAAQVISNRADAICPPGTKGFKQFNPTLRTVGASESDPSLFHISNDTATKTHTDQVFTFSNLPPTAQNLLLGWSISTTAPQFTTKGTATGRVYLVDASKLDLNAPILTAEAVANAIDTTSGLPAGRVGGAGFGFWDEFPRPNNHIISSLPIPPRSTVVMSIAIIDDGDVVIQQTGQDGLYLQYDC